MEIFNDNSEHSTSECVELIVKKLKIDETDIRKKVPSGKQTIVSNRVYWSLTYLKKALLISSLRRGFYNITDRGVKLLKSNPKRLEIKDLEKYSEFIDFKTASSCDSNMGNPIDSEEKSPDETIGVLCGSLKIELARDLLEIIYNKSAYFFEGLVLDVLYNMGYGNFKEDSISVTKKSRDEGIDGIISQDKLGIENLYIQAKKWKSDDKVGRPELQKFVGSLTSKKANKGIFITTSKFTEDAKKYIESLPSFMIKLIDGNELVNLMIEYNVGVQIEYKYEIKKIDNDYFE